MQRPVPRHRRRLIPLAALAATVPLIVLAESPASAVTDPPIVVKLTIVEINDDGDDADSNSDADFYVRGKFIDKAVEQPFDTESVRIEGEENIKPNWSFQYDAQSSTGGIQIAIDVLDYDSGFNGGDDTTISQTVDVKFSPCTVATPSLNLGCGSDVTIKGSDTMKIRVEVFYPPSSPGLRIRCLQNPLLPQPGDLVTITAETLDGTAESTKFVDDLVIEVNNLEVERQQNATTTTYQFTATGDRFRYRCYAENVDGGTDEVADTWTRDVRVGTSPEIASPIGVLGSPARNIDIVVIPDRMSYSGWNASTFHDDLYDNLWDGLYGDPYTLSRQNLFNLWLGHRSGGTNATATTCSTPTPPEDWWRFAFADAGWLFHNTGNRDCASGSLRIFTGNSTSPAVSVHEMGHTPFGLADEYTYSDADAEKHTYRQADPLPNVYAGFPACAADAPSVGRISDDCRRIRDDWYTSDPASNDLMVDNGAFQILDRRRWDWLLNRCVETAEGC
jgi:hypothetical protein